MRVAKMPDLCYALPIKKQLKQLTNSIVGTINMTLLTTARRACIVASATLALCAAAPSMAATIDFSSGTYDLTGPNQV